MFKSAMVGDMSVSRRVRFILQKESTQSPTPFGNLFFHQKNLKPTNSPKSTNSPPQKKRKPLRFPDKSSHHQNPGVVGQM